MLIDGRNVPPGSLIQVDLCIVGGGPAGISLALQFRNKPNVTVALVESGGLKWDERTQELSAAESKGQSYYPVKETHLRVLGGSTLSYSGVCAELSSLTFEERPWVPESGWPFSKAEVDRFLPRADALFGLDGRAELAAGQRSNGIGIWQKTPIGGARFGERYAADLGSASNVEVYLHSTGTKIELHPDGRRVKGVTVRCIDGPEYRIVAKHYVLAGGGIETPRLMLASNDVAAEGVGNTYDNVGRYFLDHPRMFDRYLIPCGTSALAERITGTTVPLSFSRLALSEKVQREEKLLDYHANLTVGFSGEDTPQWSAIRRIVLATKSPWKNMPYFVGALGVGPNRVRWKDVKTSVSKPHRAIQSILAIKGLVPKSARKWVEVSSSVEQVPRRHNRIVLVSERDELGMPRARLHWSLDDLEKRSYHRGRDIILEELDRLEPGLSGNRIDDPEQWPDHVVATWHHCGTTRMHVDPKKGVVDANAKVHGIDNLFVASSSVFPTSASASPTLTIVCLALRLADHLEPLLRD